MFSAEQVHQLASLYGGNTFFRMILQKNWEKATYRFFDITVSQGEIHGEESLRTLRLLSGEFSPRPLLRDLCKIFNLSYEEREDCFYLHRKQSTAIFAPETIKDTYQRMKRTEYLPSLSCSSPRAGFSVYQFRAPEGIHQILSIHLGQPSSRENPLSREDLFGLQRNLLEYCPWLSQLDYSWRTETAKDLEGWEEAGAGP